MENEVKEIVNAEEFGFDAEDLKDAEVEVTETETEETTEGEPSTTSEEETEPNEEAETETSEEPPASEHKGDTGKALAQERARRKALQKELDALRAQQQPISIPTEEITNIRNYASNEALKRMNISKDDLETLMYEDTEKYNNFIRAQAQIEYELTNRYQAQAVQYQKNQNFVNEIKSLPNFNDIYQRGVEKLNGMVMKDAAPINTAFANVDAGQGTENDFEIIRKFVETLQQDAAVNTNVENNPMKVAETLPKAGALNGGAPTPNKISSEDIMKAYDEGKEDTLPPEIREQIDKYL